jgi:hypothetical protein
MNLDRNTNKQKNSIIKNKAGFTLLLASITSSLLLAVGVSIFSIILKEIMLTTSARESQKAFYAADTGLECALYWDIKQDVFPEDSSEPDPPAGTVFCLNHDLSTVWTITKDPSSALIEFTLNFPSSTECFEVEINKTAGGTNIKSRGYNTCDTTNLRRAERGIEVLY